MNFKYMFYFSVIAIFLSYVIFLSWRQVLWSFSPADIKRT